MRRKGIGAVVDFPNETHNNVGWVAGGVELAGHVVVEISTLDGPTSVLPDFRSAGSMLVQKVSGHLMCAGRASQSPASSRPRRHMRHLSTFPPVGCFRSSRRENSCFSQRLRVHSAYFFIGCRVAGRLGVTRPRGF